MNLNQDTDNSFCENKKSYFRFLKDVFTLNGILNFDGCKYSSQYNEKLPIIYANIRVWILD